MVAQQNIAVLGATGSIGRCALNVIARHPLRFKIVALVANTQVDRLFEQCLRFRPDYAIMVDCAAARKLSGKLGEAGVECQVMCGMESVDRIVTLSEIHTIVAGIVGAAGLQSVLAAARAGKRILLANKEPLVMAGSLLINEAFRNRAVLLPVDSEHNAVFQALPNHFSGDLADAGVRRIMLTASGGPFRLTPSRDLAQVTPEQACAHPTWTMGRKISVDSATLMNKGLEVIEAHWLFNADPCKIEVMVHPQSIVHSLVEYIDGSVLAQLCHPDMRVPIAHALGFPVRIDSGADYLNLFKVRSLEFEEPDQARFPCLGLAYKALDQGGTTPVILNAANEIAVAAFLNRRVGFLQIPALIEDVLGRLSCAQIACLEDVLEADRTARATAEKLVRQWEGGRPKHVAVPARYLEGIRSGGVDQQTGQQLI